MSRAFSRTLAVALLVLLVVILWRVAVAPLWSRFAQDREAIAEARGAIARYQQLTARRDEFQKAIDELDTDEGLERALLSAGSSTLAAAQLQQRVKATVEQHGGSLVSSQVLDAERKGPFAKVRVNVRMSVSVEELQNVLHELESQLPILVLDGMQAQSRRARRRRGAANRSQGARLDVRLQLAGFLTVEDSTSAPARSGSSG